MSVTITLTAQDGATSQIVLPDPPVGSVLGDQYSATLTMGATAYKFDATRSQTYVGQFVQQKSIGG